MIFLEWLLLILLAVTIVSSLWLVLVAIMSLRTKAAYNTIASKKSRRRKKSGEQETLKRYKQKWQQQKRGLLLLSLLVLLAGGSSFGTRYYLTTQLATTDAQQIVTSYYLVENFEAELKKISGENPEQAQQALRVLSAKMASFGLSKASGSLSLERQQSLNRYYNGVKELGLNLSNQSLANLEKGEIFTSFTEDLKKLKATRKDVLALFKIDETTLKVKK